MKDFFGTEINVGDEVITMERSYKVLYRADVIKVCDKMVLLNLRTQSGADYSTERRYPRAVCVITKHRGNNETEEQ